MEQSLARREASARYHKKNPWHHRYKAYQQRDRNKGFENNLNKEWVFKKMKERCFYCQVSESGGLDRIDNNQGHWTWNTLPCCEKCNWIMSDLPHEACMWLKSGLQKIRDNGYFDKWEIPIKRRRINGA